MNSLRWLTVLAVVSRRGRHRPHAGTRRRRTRLRERLERRYDLVPLTDGVGLRPKARGDVRLVEVTAGAVLVNGAAVTGRELRDRLGEDADAVLRLSYLPADELRDVRGATRPRAAFGTPARRLRHRNRRRRSSAGAGPADPRTWAARSHGDRIRIFGDIAVERDEEITGQVVAVFGSVRVNGKVGDQVVAVLGSVVLGTGRGRGWRRGVGRRTGDSRRPERRPAAA